MNRIEEQARYYRNIPLRDRNIKSVVHLEDAEDILFWSNQLQKAFPATYHFITYSKNEKGRRNICKNALQNPFQIPISIFRCSCKIFLLSYRSRFYTLYITAKVLS